MLDCIRSPTGSRRTQISKANPELQSIDMHGVSLRRFSDVTGTQLYFCAKLESKHSEHC